MSLNQCILAGNLGRDPEMRETSGGHRVATLNLAVNRAWTDDSGKKREDTGWHRVIAWNRLADVCVERLGKGSPILVVGRLQTREWEKDGQRQFTTEIVARSVTFLDREADAGWSGGPPPPDDDAYFPGDEEGF